MKVMLRRVAPPLGIALAVAACGNRDLTFGRSYDACILKHGVSDETRAICERHFARPPSAEEAKQLLQGMSAAVRLDQPPDGLLEKKPWDDVWVTVANRPDDLVVTKARVTAMFYSDPGRTHALPSMPLTWDLKLNIGPNGDDNGTEGSFENEKAPSRYYRVRVEPVQVYSHTKG